MQITNWSIRHSITIIVLMFVLTLAGFVAYMGLPREAAPDITIPLVLVTTPYIGVSPSDIETLVTNPLEDELKQLKDVRELRSTSAEGASIVQIEFEPSVVIDDALQKIRERVDAAKQKLPKDAEDTIISEISFSEFPIMVVSLSGDVGLLRLKQVAERMQDRIESIQGILEVKLSGGLEREIHVEADPRMLEFYKLGVNDLISTIQRENITMPGGAVDVGTLKYSVRVPGEFEQVKDIESLIIKEPDGEPIYVRDVAKVVNGYEDRKSFSRLDGTDSVSLSISRRAGENIPEIAAQVKDIVKEFEGKTGGVIKYAVLADVSEDIESQVSELENNIFTALILVGGVLLFFMGGMRNALFVAIAIPLSMLLSFSILSLMSITLNIVVLFSLVLALGMLVDNAIVIVENIYRHAHMGKTMAQAAADGVEEVAWPVIASTATTVGAFFPMMFWPGIMGEFMSFLPLTVIIVLLSSLFVALVINPVVCALFMKVAPPKPGAPPFDPDDELSTLPNNLLYRVYEATLRFSVRHRWFVALLLIGSFVGTMAAFAKHDGGVEFFPETTPKRVFIKFSLPEGSNVKTSDRMMRSADRVIKKIGAQAKTWTTDVGIGGGGNPFGGGSSAENSSQITLDFAEAEDQLESPYKTIEHLREMFKTDAAMIGAEVKIDKQGNGPPTGPPINIEIVGEDYIQLGQIADRARQKIRLIDGVVNLKDNFSSGRSELTIRVKREEASDLGLSTMTVANTVRTAINGAKASVFRENDEEYDIIVRLRSDARSSIDAINDLKLKSKDGDQVMLTDVAEVITQPAFGSIRHIDGERVVTISADVAKTHNAVAVLEEVQKTLADGFTLPAGYDLRYTGQNKDQAEAQVFLSKALLGALFIIALILVTQFNSMMQPLIIIASVVLSLLGVLWMLLLRHLPFSVIMTGIGIISLAGIVVNNAIVLIDYTNQLKAKGVPSKEAVVQAGMVRFRPVMLTAITTLLSLMPIVLGYSLDVKNFAIIEGGNSVEMWGPMANAVVAGLAVATALTLVVVPVMYSGIDSLTDSFSRLRGRFSRKDPDDSPLPDFDEDFDEDLDEDFDDEARDELPSEEAQKPRSMVPSLAHNAEVSS